MSERGRRNCRPAWAVLLLIAIVGVAFGGLKLHSLLADPGMVLLIPEHGAQWIRVNAPLTMGLWSGEDYIAGFRTFIKVDKPPTNAVLVFKGMRRVNATLDDQLVASSGADENRWKEGAAVDLAPYLTPGTHELHITAINSNGPACVLAYCEPLGLRTGSDWEATRDGQTWAPAIDVTTRRVLSLSRAFERTDRALLRLLPLYAPIFLAVAALTLWGRRLPLAQSLRVAPSTVRWFLLAAWAVLGVNAAARLHLDQGFDVAQHIEYICYVAEHARIPFANEGWQMFQSPLYYLISAPLYLFFTHFTDPDTAARLLRVIPLLSGFAQIEIAYRVVRLIFPTRNDVQILGTLLGGLLPMNTYMSLYVSNEPLAGFFTGLAVLVAINMLHSDTPFAWRLLAALGVSLGLAMLTKLTPVLLLLPVGMLLLYLAFVREESVAARFRRVALSCGVVFGIAALIAGWYYVRNYLHLGRFFIGGWDPARGTAWWQEPGCRVPRDFYAFGEGLFYPVYATFSGFWDGIYSTFWFDGMLSANGEFECKPEWNYGLLLSGVWLALLPALAMITGLIMTLRKPSASARNGLLFAALCIALYGAALGYHFLSNPNYCAAKAFYSVGITSCYAVLGAAGFELFTRSKMLRPVIYGLFACWVFSAYGGYFIL